jgi:uncharacterized damage-inducible protein DinB
MYERLVDFFKDYGSGNPRILVDRNIALLATKQEKTETEALALLYEKFESKITRLYEKNPELLPQVEIRVKERRRQREQPKTESRETEIEEELPDIAIRETLVETFNRNWDMYHEAVKKIPDEHWRTGEISYLTPARIIYHVLECVDFYSNPTSEGYNWGHRFNIDWEEDVLSEKLPTKEQTKEYLEEMIEKLNDWLQELSDSDLLSPEKAFPWTGKTTLGRALYILVHSRQHLGEINAELRRRGLSRVEWQ